MVLEAHHEDTRPAHIFGDICDRVPGPQRFECANVLKQCTAEYKKAVQQLHDQQLGTPQQDRSCPR
eukprot:12129803-Alexandrium_andersonii.AAC.1